ncbi:hypothetical protein ACFQ1I_00085 [Kitasatospora arboriphila]
MPAADRFCATLLPVVNRHPAARRQPPPATAPRPCRARARARARARQASRPCWHGPQCRIAHAVAVLRRARPGQPAA